MIVSDKLKGRFWRVEIIFIDDYDLKERKQTYITYGENHAEVGAQIDRWYEDMINDITSVKIEILSDIDEPYMILEE